MIHHKRVTLSFMFAAILPSVGFTEEPSLAPGLSTRSLSPIPETAPYPITVINRDTIQSLQPRTIADMLRLVPGMFVGFKFGNQASIGYSSAGNEFSNRIQFMLNGREIYVAATGGVFLQNLPVQINDIERIEVIRAPSSAYFGGAALQATINIITAHAAEKSESSIAVRGGENGIKDYYLQYGNRVGETSFSVSYDERNDEGLIGRNDDRTDRSLWLRTDTTLNDKSAITVETGYAHGEYQAGGSNPASDPLRPLDERHSFFNLAYRYVMSETDDFSANVFYDHFNNNQQWIQTIPRFGRFYHDRIYDYRRYGVELGYNGAISPSWTYHVGVRAHDDYISGRLSLYPNDGSELVIHNQQLFASTSYGVNESNTINVGAMYEGYSVTNGQDISGTLSWNTQWTEYQSTRIGIHQGSRYPFSYEQFTGRAVVALDMNNTLFYQIIPPEGDLNNERSTTTEIAWMWNSSELQGQLRLYNEKLDHLIRLTSVAARPGFPPFSTNGRELMFDNDDASLNTDALEASLQYHIKNDWTIMASVVTKHMDSSSSNPFTDIATAAPKHLHTLVVNKILPLDVQISLNYVYASDFHWSDDPETEGYEKLGLHASKCFEDIGLHSLCLRASVDNVLGNVSDYSEDRFADRQSYVSVEASF